MSALAPFSLVSVEILEFSDDGLLRQVRASGWRYREFFLRREGDEFRPFHLPTGLALPFYFAVIDAAAAFVTELDRQRNQWRDLTRADWQELRDTMIALALGHAADVAGFHRAEAPLFRSRLNGYGGGGMTAEQLNVLVEMASRGKSDAQIGLRLGMSPGAISYYRLKEAIERPQDAKRPPRPLYAQSAPYRRGKHLVRPFTPEDDRALLEWEGQGLRIVEMARRLGRRHNAVKGRLMSLARHDERAERFAALEAAE